MWMAAAAASLVSHTRAHTSDDTRTHDRTASLRAPTFAEHGARNAAIGPPTGAPARAC